MTSRILYSSQSEIWETPPALFQALNRQFDFQLDVCALPENAKCAHFFTAKEDGLSQDWASYKRVWMNPPYGRPIGKWMQKAYAESRKGCMVVCLVPVRSDTRWWHDWVEGKAHVTFIRGRLQFAPRDRHKKRYPAPFPSAIVIYGMNVEKILDQKTA